MSLFSFRATDTSGHEQRGTVEAGTVDAVASILRDRAWTIVSIREQKKGFGLQTQIPFLNRVKTKDLVILSRQLAVMVTANVPIVQALTTLVEQTTNPNLKEAVSSISDDVEGGALLSQALARHPRIFPEFYVSMIKSGESAGKLDTVLEYLANQQEKDYDLLTRVRGAMIYPLFILGGLIIVGAVMMIFVIPKLTGILTESGAKLPLSTRILMSTSDFFVHQWWALLIIIVALIAGVQIAVRFPRGRYAWDWLLLRLPVFGALLQEIMLVRFFRSLGTLLQGGVPLPRCLEIVSGIVHNRVFVTMLEHAIDEVRDGHAIAKVFTGHSFIPAMVPQMFSVGERTGNLTMILETLANFYTRHVDNRVTNLVSLIEPLVIVVMGVAVAIMVTAVLLPIYNLAGAV